MIDVIPQNFDVGFVGNRQPLCPSMTLIHLPDLNILIPHRIAVILQGNPAF